MAKQKIDVQGIKVTIEQINNKDYISLTDIAKQVNDRTDLVLSNWLRNAGTLDFLYEWELLYNEDFKPFKFEGIRTQAGKVGFVMTAKKWIETTDAIGIISKAGRYGGTYAHRDIAMEFCSAISARFKLHLIREYQVLKDKQQTDWLKEAKFYIESDSEIESLKLYNLLGKEMQIQLYNYGFKKEIKLLDNLSDGIYLLNISLENKRIVKRINIIK